MRAWLAISVLALTACAAEADVETISELKEEVAAEVKVTTVDELLEDIRKNGSPLEAQKALKKEGQKLVAAQTTNPKSSVDSFRKLLDDVKEQSKYSVPHANNLFRCRGIAKQGGLVVCKTAPNARVEVGRSENDTYTQTANKDGILLVGFDRDEPAAFVRIGDERIDFDIQPREYDTSRIDGLPKRFVSEYTPEQLEQIRKASALKKVGFASKVEEVGFKNGFIFPVTTHTKTTNFGAQRILNGDPKRPHFGVDLAAPKGTPILAPADGIVSLASEEMYFEGSLIMIDHGQGLISYYLHNETVDDEVGQRVTQGQQIGTVGSRGRSTGPHLCWRLKWRGRNLDPELLTEWPQSG